MTGEIIVGKFVDRDRPDYQSMMWTQFQQVLGDRYVEKPEPVCS